MAATYRDSIAATGSGSTITVSSTGLTFVSGDVLVLHVWGYATLGAPSGGNTTWAEEVTRDQLDPGSLTVTHRVYTGTAGATITDFTLSNGAADEYAWMLTAVSGADTAAPEDGVGADSADFASVADPRAPSISPAGTDSLLLCACSAMAEGNAAFSFTAPSGMTEREDIDAWFGYSLATLGLSASGATGTKSFIESPSQSTAGERWTASSIAIKSAAVGGGLTIISRTVLDYDE